MRVVEWVYSDAQLGGLLWLNWSTEVEINNEIIVPFF